MPVFAPWQLQEALFDAFFKSMTEEDRRTYLYNTTCPINTRKGK